MLLICIASNEQQTEKCNPDQQSLIISKNIHIDFEFSLIRHNGHVYGWLRVYVRRFSAGKSDVVNLQTPLVKPKIDQLFLYIVGTRF